MSEQPADSPSGHQDLEARIRRIEARIAIQELIAVYSFTIDLRDMDALMACFTRDVEFRRADGSIATGNDQLREYLSTTMKDMGPTWHVAHPALTLTFEDDTTASGIHYGHAEHAVNDELIYMAAKYRQGYKVEDGRWKISRRILDFFYFCRMSDVINHYGSRDKYWHRGVEGEVPTAIEQWPFQAQTFRDFYGLDKA